MTNLTDLLENKLHLNGKHESKYDFNKYRITYKSKISAITPVITIADSIFVAKGDVSFVTGQAKAGKTAISIFMLATALLEQLPPGFDSLQIRTTYAKGNPVIYIDTEQKDAYTDRLRKRVCDLLGVDKEPDNLYIFNLRKVPRKHKLAVVKDIITDLDTPHIIIIDGMADLVSDPNKPDESFDVIDDFMIMADVLDTAIIGYIHENPNTTKVRGNFGSEAERKCGGFINVRKDKATNIHSIESRMMKGSADFESIPFRFSKEKDRMVSVGGEELEQFKKETNKETAKEEVLRKLAKQCFAGGDHISYTELINRIKLYSLPIEGKQIKTEKSASKRRQEMVDKNIISLDEYQKYYLVNEKNTK